MLQSLQDYVQEEQVTEDNIKQLVNWVRETEKCVCDFFTGILMSCWGSFMAKLRGMSLMK